MSEAVQGQCFEGQGLKTVSGVRLTGICSAIPETSQPVSAFDTEFGRESVSKIAASTGVLSRRIAKRLCTSDLCEGAARRLLEATGVSPDSVDTLVFVSQTPDYVLPATACTLQYRLGLPNGAAAFDVNLGCSGYVYGLWLASSLIAGGGSKRVLLLVGDTISRTVSPQDRSVALLFGDAGSATLLEADADAGPLHFVLGTDGAGKDHLKIPAGAFRRPADDGARLRTEREGGNKRAEADLYMNGAEIFSFTLKRVPAMIGQLMSSAGLTSDDIDAYVFHQANRFMLQHLAKRMALPAEKVVLSLEQFGNTSSASIPLALTSRFAGSRDVNRRRLVLAGFGVGYSWGAAALSLRGAVLPDLVVVGEAAPVALSADAL